MISGPRKLLRPNYQRLQTPRRRRKELRMMKTNLQAQLLPEWQNLAVAHSGLVVKLFFKENSKWLDKFGQ
jgi:hypothetical protein